MIIDAGLFHGIIIGCIALVGVVFEFVIWWLSNE